MEDRLNQHGVMVNGILTRFCSMVLYTISLLSVVAKYYTQGLLIKIMSFYQYLCWELVKMYAW